MAHGDVSRVPKRHPIARKIGRVAGWIFGGLFGLVLVALACVNLKPARELIRNKVNGALANSFTGKVVIDRLGGIGPTSLHGVDARIFDPHGKRVLWVSGLSVRSNWPKIAWGALRGQPLVITLTPLSCRHIEVDLIDDGSGSPTIASAFNPKNPSPPSKESSTVTVRVPEIDVDHVWAHGGLNSVPVIDAEISQLRAGFALEPTYTQIEVARANLVTRGLPAAANPSGKLKASLRLPSAKDAKPSANADFDGKLAGAPAKLTGKFDKDVVDAALSARAIPAEVLRAQLPSLSLQGETALELHADGPLSGIAVRGEIDNPAAKLRVHGTARVENETKIDATLDILGLNARGIVASAPETRVNGTLKASADLASNGDLHGAYALELPSASLNELALPAISADGKLARAGQGPFKVDGKLHAAEPGADTRVSYDLSFGDQSFANVELDSHIDNPPRAQKLVGLATRGNLHADAKVNLTQSTVLANVQAKLAPVALAENRMAALELRAKATGPFSNPNLDFALTADDISAGSQRFKRVHATGGGKLERVAVNAEIDRPKGDRAIVHTVIGGVGPLLLLEPSVAFASREGDITLRARGVNLAGQRIRVEGFEIAGAGNARGNALIHGSQIDASFEFDQLDLGRLRRVSGIDLPLDRALLSGSGHVSGSVPRLRGKLALQARNIDSGSVRDGHVDVNLEVGERTISGTLDLKLNESNVVAKIDDLEVPAKFSKAALLNTRGAIDVSGKVDLSRMTPLLRRAGVPIERARGTLDLNLRAQNPKEGASHPTVTLAAKTQGLQLVEQRPPLERIEATPRARETEPRAIVGVDLDLNAELDANAHKAKVALGLNDRLGPFLALNAASDSLDFNSQMSAAELERLPLKVDLSLPKRDIGKWPTALRPQAMRGVLQGLLHAEGNAREPKLTASFEVKSFRSRERGRSVDADAQLQYEPRGGELLLVAESKNPRERNAQLVRVADLTTNWQGDLLARLRAGENDKPPLDLDADLKLNQFPLVVIAPLSDRNVRGPLSGELSLRDFGKDAKLDAHFEGKALKLGQAKLPTLDAIIKADGKSLNATVDGKQPSGDLQAIFKTPMTWGAGLAPVVDSHANARVVAHQFELEALSPFLLAYVSTIEGKLDADLNIDLSQGAPKLQGQAEMQKGIVQLPQVGQRLSDVHAKVTIGNDEIRISSLEAKGTSGRLTANAVAKLVGADLQSVKAALDIKKNDKLPITFEGVSYGDAWGHADMTYLKSDAATQIRVDVPAFHMVMPDTSLASVQDLAPAEHVRIGIHREDGKFVALPAQPLGANDTDPNARPTPTLVNIHLGNNVWFERGSQALVQLRGDLAIKSGDQTSITGKIDLQGGKLDVNGKTFDVEHGEVSFDGGDPSNPTIVATARWDAPGYSVYADYSGTVKAGKLNLHSEPQLTQTEIISLLLFGSPEGSLGSSDSGGGAAATAVGLAGDTATRGFNRVMSDFTHLDVQARIDTSSGSARPELVVQVSPRITTRVSRVVGTPAPGQPPDLTFLTVDFRLQRAWSVSAEIGDHGSSSLDLIWRRRY